MGEIDREWFAGRIQRHLEHGSTEAWALAKAIIEYRHLRQGIMDRTGHYVDPDAMKRRRK